MNANSGSYVALALIVASYFTVSHLLMVWAALARWPHWFWRVLIVLGWIALTLPNEVNDIGFLLLIEAAVVVPLGALLRYCLTRDEQGQRLRFRLRDMGLAVVVVAIGLALGQHLERKWPPLAFVAFGTLQALPIILASAVVRSARFRWRILMGTLFAAFLAGASIVMRYSPWFDEQVLGLAGNLGFAVEPGYEGVASVAMFLPSAVLTLAILELRTVEDSASRRHKLVRDGMAVAIIAPLLCLTTWTMYRVAVPVSLPPVEMPEPNAYEVIMDLTPRWYELVSVPHLDEHGGEACIVFVEQHAQDIDRLRSALAHPGKVILTDDLGADLDRVQVIRNLTKAMVLKAEYESSPERALIGRDLLRLGNRATVGGSYIDRLASHSSLIQGVDLIARERRLLDSATRAMLIRELQALDTTWESGEVVATRDRAYTMRTCDWTLRVAWVAEELSGAPTTDLYATFWHNTLARLRLLEAELALQSYYEKQQRWPPHLDELVPEYLPAVPIDPFVDQPLIYRAEGNGYTLYSVGMNGIDDGGAFVGWGPMVTGAPADLWIDILSYDQEQEANRPPMLTPPYKSFTEMQNE